MMLFFKAHVVLRKDAITGCLQEVTLDILVLSKMLVILSSCKFLLGIVSLKMCCVSGFIQRSLLLPVFGWSTFGEC